MCNVHSHAFVELHLLVCCDEAGDEFRYVSYLQVDNHDCSPQPIGKTVANLANPNEVYNEHKGMEGMADIQVDYKKIPLIG